ncbi:UDP-glucose 4-epimerase GalE [Saccharothrix violaceirubra]|uniref:UDP-glucose 4-epimerase n=1 Tax=Saccharothrix violaceirubra TaxID=413306 RepID=A0A7W7T9I5_9PSEU|nr:NAD-dependent epimerase/dehydratase family protein [Saccharothrix violaceirubra]MBB4969051.1 UDP-glucose 4-epimerase [Saccharothrix violaceirubra]
MRVMITGAAGYVGRAVVAELDRAGHAPVPFAGDVRDSAAVEAAVRGVDAVVHLAARSRVRESFDRAAEYFDVNVGGTLNVVRARPAVLLLASTAGVYAPAPSLSEDSPLKPTNPYAASKAVAEEVVRWTPGASAVLRLFNVAGGGDADPTRVITKACLVAAGREPSMRVFGNGSAVRDFVHVRDVARAFVAVLENTSSGHEVYNVGATPASVAEVIATTERVASRPVAVEWAPANPGEVRELRADTAKLRDLGWSPEESGLSDLIADQWRSTGA